MIIRLPDSNTRDIVRALQRIHETATQTTGRVLTLIVCATSRDDLDTIISTTTAASREHPSRVIVLIDDEWSPRPHLDAEVRYGGNVGACELVLIRMHGSVSKHPVSVVTPLLLPDTPIVAWWPSQAPANPAKDPIGRIAQRRITDAFHEQDTHQALLTRRASYADGDSDISWARITQWRGIVASTLDIYPRDAVNEVHLTGHGADPSIDLAAGWLAHRLQVPVTRWAYHGRTDVLSAPHTPVTLTLKRASGDVVVDFQPEQCGVTVTMPARPTMTVAMDLRPRADCLAEELRHLDPDQAYAAALRGIGAVTYSKQ